MGDARNETLYAYEVFGARDLAQRCLWLAAHSLDRLPMVGSQVPSAWEQILPAWSFLWTVAVWDYAWQTGSKGELRRLFPWVERNLAGALARLDAASGLFRAPAWNMFDWAGIDDRHEIVLHNSFLMVGALQAARRCARLLGETVREEEWRRAERRLVRAVRMQWDPQRECFPDALDAQGRPVAGASVHTSFLVLLYDAVPRGARSALVRHTVHGAPGLTSVGSPFALQFCFEALERIKADDVIIARIRQEYAGMLAAGATTVWETFPGSTCSPPGFPTRSHCHAWSAAPITFLHRIVLGVRARTAGGRAYEVSPRPCGLTWAEGTVATPRGPLDVRWRIEGATLAVALKAPTGVAVRVARNEHCAGLGNIEGKPWTAAQRLTPSLGGSDRTGLNEITGSHNKSARGSSARHSG